MPAPPKLALTEDDVVAALRELSGAPGGRKIVVGIGDDAAVWRPSRSHVSAITTDALLEGVHFSRQHFTLEQIGHRAMASNLSDVAAMGARPVLATVALGVPQELGLDDVRALYRGMDALAKRHGTTIAGGDLIRARALLLSITIVGEVRPSNLKRRSGGRAGDVLAVTGPLGASRAGFDALARTDVLDDDLANVALAKHRTPEPRMAQGRWLAASRSVHAMMDLSDGVARDVPRLAAASHLAATLQHIPVAPAARLMAAATGADPLQYACEGGEDFELLVAVAPRALRHLCERFEDRFGHTLYPIGTLHEGTGVMLHNADGERPLRAAGWDHFAQ